MLLVTLMQLMLMRVTAVVEEYSQHGDTPHPIHQVYVQLGEQRSASTRQEMAIQAALSLKYPHIPVHHAYAWESNCDERTYRSARDRGGGGIESDLNLTSVLTQGDLVVIKMHNQGKAMECITRLTGGTCIRTIAVLLTRSGLSIGGLMDIVKIQQGHTECT